MRLLICSCILSLHFLELVKKKEKYSFQLVNDYVTDIEKRKKDTISLKKMNLKSSLCGTLNLSREKIILAKLHDEKTQSMS